VLPSSLGTHGQQIGAALVIAGPLFFCSDGTVADAQPHHKGWA